MGLKRCKRIKDYDARQEALLHYCLKKTHNLRPRLRPIPSIMEEPHCHMDYPDSDEYYTEFWIEDGWEDATDEELKQYCKDQKIFIYGFYDCTGKEFTVSIRYHRNKSGLVSFIHEKALDL